MKWHGLGERTRGKRETRRGRSVRRNEREHGTIERLYLQKQKFRMKHIFISSLQSLDSRQVAVMSQEFKLMNHI